ncbi:MAG: rhomboid family intramembrane serine protease [Planctomycetes bacterium]|nr:rhomboid family intramembrane serine protease [Planctomycetota bacterium]
MIPLRDHNPSRSFPVIVVAIIVLNAAAFIAELSLGLGGESERAQSVVADYGLRPQLIAAYLRGERAIALESIEPPRTPADAIFGPRRSREEIRLTFLSVFLPLLTSMFLHGGWLHLVGNLWFLWIFGDNVEDRLGRIAFVGFYLAGGIIASLVHIATNLSSPVPTIGASGAISAVLGAYLVFFPRARVLALVPLGFFLTSVDLPAPLFLGVWFLFQLVPGIAQLGAGAATGVAFWAHIGGFVFGAAVAAIAGRPRDRDRVGRYVPFRILD